jgi:hypothetical protein
LLSIKRSQHKSTEFCSATPCPCRFWQDGFSLMAVGHTSVVGDECRENTSELRQGSDVIP